MAAVTLIEAVTLALAHEMARDDSVLVLGEDVGVNGGVFRHHDGIDLFVQFVEHPAEVLERLCPGMLLVDVPCPFRVHIAEADEVDTHAAEVIEVTPSLAADADAGEIQLIVGFIGKSKPGAWQEQKRSASQGRGSQEIAPGAGGFHGGILVGYPDGNKMDKYQTLDFEFITHTDSAINPGHEHVRCNLPITTSRFQPHDFCTAGMLRTGSCRGVFRVHAS